MHPEEAQLLAQLRRGDPRAFAELVERYKGMILNLAVRMTGNAETANDLAQDVFVRVWKALPSFRGDCKLSTWIYRIALNLCIAEGKTARGRGSFLSMEDPGLSALPQMRTDSEGGYSEEVVLKERMVPLLAKMPSYYRTAITLYYLKDLSYQEISEIMGVPIGTVKSYLFRGKAWLRDRLLGKTVTSEDTP